MASNKIRQIDVLRREKQILREECAQGEENIGLYWHYVNHNLGSLLLHGAISGMRNRLGFGKKSKAIDHHDTKDDESEESGISGLFQGALGGLIAASPIIWDLVQPMATAFAIRKFKSMFSGKKKAEKEKKKDKEKKDKKKKSGWW